MSYVKIEDLNWDTLPGGSLVSTVRLFDVDDTAQNPDDEENPFHGPGTIEYRLLEGKVIPTLSPPTPIQA